MSGGGGRPGAPVAGLLAIALALTGTSCDKTDPNEIVVGAYLSLSGPDTTFGTDSREGIELAREEINKAGGIKGRHVTVIYADDKSKTAEASQKVRQLIDRNNVVALLGEVASSRSLAGGLIANTKHVPMITPSSTAVKVTVGREWVFRTCPTDDQQGIVAARFVKEKLGRQRVAIFYSAQDTYSSGLARSFRAAFEKLGGGIVADKGYQKGETNFRTYLSELKAASPEVIFVPNYYSDMVLIARQAKELGIPGSTFMGGDGWDSMNLVEGAGRELEGAHYTNHYAPDIPWPAPKRFLSAFTAKYGHQPTSIAAQGYDAARVLFDAIDRAREPRRDAIRAALAETRGFVGATGAITLDENRNANKPIVVVRIKNKQFTYATELSANDSASTSPNADADAGAGAGGDGGAPE